MGKELPVTIFIRPKTHPMNDGTWNDVQMTGVDPSYSNARVWVKQYLKEKSDE